MYGEFIEDLPGIISSYRSHHHQRMDLVWNVIKQKPGPVLKLIDDIFPYVLDEEMFLAVPEIIAHLEILINEGRAELSDPGPPALYRALQ